MLSRHGLRRTLVVVVLGLVMLLTGAARAFHTRRRARLHDFHAGWFAAKAARHQEAARDAREYGGDTMLQVAHAFEAKANTEYARSEYHRELGRAYWYALLRPWIILPPEPSEPPMP